MRGFSFSWKRALGITGVKQKIARSTGIPTTKSGMERKIGSSALGSLFAIVFAGNHIDNQKSKRKDLISQEDVDNEDDNEIRKKGCLKSLLWIIIPFFAIFKLLFSGTNGKSSRKKR